MLAALHQHPPGKACFTTKILSYKKKKKSADYNADGLRSDMGKNVKRFADTAVLVCDNSGFPENAFS